MKIRVKLFGQFMERFGFSEKELDVSHPFTAGDLVTLLGMDDMPKIVARKNQALRPSEHLEDGDRVTISPIFSGG